MEVIRVIKTKDYTTICNRIYKNKNITLKAKGLLSMILSLSPHWQLSVEGLVKICKEGRTSISNTLSELIQAGYINREQVRIENKFAGYRYIVFESMGNPSTENLKTENLQQLNTIDNKILSNKSILALVKLNYISGCSRTIDRTMCYISSNFSWSFIRNCTKWWK